MCGLLCGRFVLVVNATISAESERQAGKLSLHLIAGKRMDDAGTNQSAFKANFDVVSRATVDAIRRQLSFSIHSRTRSPTLPSPARTILRTSERTTGRRLQ